MEIPQFVAKLRNPFNCLKSKHIRYVPYFLRSSAIFNANDRMMILTDRGSLLCVLTSSYMALFAWYIMIQC